MLHRTSFPSAIAHLDCNSFFASVEQAYNPKLKGKPVLVTGLGGHCVITASYEARKFGIKTGQPVWEARKICPSAVIIPGDFRHYQIFHQNLINIAREYTPDVEVASIDECYLDLKGLRRLYRKPYSEICWSLKEDIKKRLGITVSIGLSTSKVIAKTASNFKKPDGLTVVSGKNIEEFLQKVALEDIRGFGSNTQALLHKQGIHTPLQYIQAKSSFIKQILGKTGLEMQMELQGYSVRPVSTSSSIPKSLSRTRSFQVTSDKLFIYQEILKNLSLAFWHLRSQGLKTQNLALMLRTDTYQIHSEELKLPEDLNCETAILKSFKSAFERLYRPNIFYRSSGVITTSLQAEDQIPLQLFPKELETKSQISIFQKIDQINEKYGDYTLTLGSISHYKNRENQLEKLSLPYLGEAI